MKILAIRMAKYPPFRLLKPQEHFGGSLQNTRWSLSAIPLFSSQSLYHSTVALVSLVLLQIHLLLLQGVRSLAYPAFSSILFKIVITFHLIFLPFFNSAINRAGKVSNFALIFSSYLLLPYLVFLPHEHNQFVM